MPIDNMPAAEVDIDAALVQALLEQQHPDLASLPLELLTNGFDNVIYRLGGELIVRLPRRTLGAELIAHEQRWLPDLAPRLPLPIPVPVRIGAPGLAYPWSWSVCPWLPGTTAAVTPPDDMRATAAALGDFVAAMHAPAPADAPGNAYRGGPLATRADATQERLELLHDVVDAEALRARWRELLATPPWDGPPIWLHGDLHPGNLLVHSGRLSGVIDFGDMCGGDPATDLSAAWIFFDRDTRHVFRAAAGGDDDDTWQRAKGWALALGLAYVASSGGARRLGEIGRRALDEVLRD
jgi:aminoglycoside phosphotransferase (APT) family kinase protein